MTHPTALRLPRAPVAVVMIALGAALAACNDVAPLRVRYELSEGPAQKCPATCSSVLLNCKSVLSVRIVDPVNPGVALVPPVCRVLEQPRSLCEIGRVELPDEERLPLRRLAIQVAVFNYDDVAQPDGTLVCPSDLPFDAINFAAPSRYRPAVAGMGYYQPGDAETVVKLGCADLTVVNTPVCSGDDRVRITASADDFDTGVFLQSPSSVQLTVGEPISSVNPDTLRTEYSMPLNKVFPLRLGDGPRAGWSGEAPTQFRDSACIEVFENASQVTKSITCKRITKHEASLDLRGIRMSRTTLNAVLAAIGEPTFPKSGLVIGMVLDEQGKPVERAVVRPSTGSVRYLGSGRDRLIDDGTSSNGIFVSTNAPFLTSWTAVGTAEGYGGLVDERVTIVILQPDAKP
jgi:hypothetical protein